MDNSLKQEILLFLRSQFIMSLAATDGTKPVSTILLFHVDDDLNFFFATHTDSHKTTAILNNPNVSFSVWQHGDMLIQADGRAEEITDESAKLEAVDRIAESTVKGEEFWPPLFRIKGTDYIVFKITPTWMRKLDLTRDTITQDTSPFETLISHPESHE